VTLLDENMKFFFPTGKNLTLSMALGPELDLDLNLSKRLDPDPHIMNADPIHGLVHTSNQ
jgi:hypothetical protein